MRLVFDAGIRQILSCDKAEGQQEQALGKWVLCPLPACGRKLQRYERRQMGTTVPHLQLQISLPTITDFLGVILETLFSKGSLGWGRVLSTRNRRCGMSPALNV